MAGEGQEKYFRKLLNFRDIGGIPAMDGKTVRQGIVFRSANPDRLGRTDMEVLQELGIRTIIDLRASHEVRRRAVIFDHAERISLPLDFTQTTRERLRPVIYKRDSEELIAEISNVLYLEILDASLPVFRKVMEVIDTASGLPLLIHCQAGKDRTGIISALILLALGVGREYIVKDFMKSNEALIPFFRRHFMIRSVLSLGLFPYSNLLFAVTVRKKNIESILDRIEYHYGGVGLFLRSSGFDMSRLDAVREKLLSDKPSPDTAGFET
jgi:protein-tyrosine phosphatase